MRDGQNSHAIIRHNSIRSARLEVPFDVALAVDLYTAKDILWPANQENKRMSTLAPPNKWFA